MALEDIWGFCFKYEVLLFGHSNFSKQRSCKRLETLEYLHIGNMLPIKQVASRSDVTKILAGV